MDVDMYAHEAVQANLAKLQSVGDTVLEAESGPLASGLVGQGRLPEPETMFEAVRALVQKSPWWQGKKVLITAGPTRERLDPVRYVGNLSSGKMGYALAHELAGRGAKVVLVSGPSAEVVQARSIALRMVESADQMAQACADEADADVQIFAAAVADFKPPAISDIKIKKEGSGLNIALTENVDIAAAQGAKKKAGQLFIGFALESGDGLEAAKSKLARKSLDLICLNTLDGPLGSPLGSDANAYHLLSKSGKEFILPPAHKTTLAGQLADVIETL
jgi:phosphopantothenoylcysteine decarboxylase/phosphopantothenate--cysteine ligase